MASRFASNRSFIHGEIILGVLTSAFGYAGIAPGTMLHMMMHWVGMVDLAAMLIASGTTMAAAAAVDAVVAVTRSRACRCLAIVRGHACLVTCVVWLAIAVGGFRTSFMDAVSALTVMPWVVVPYGLMAYVANQSVAWAMSKRPTPGLRLDRRRG